LSKIFLEFATTKGGILIGEPVGKIEGELVGKIEGELVGKIEGEPVGKIEGEPVGKIEGEPVGDTKHFFLESGYPGHCTWGHASVFGIILVSSKSVYLLDSYSLF